ncbi:MAG: ParB/RepB/Spo0J family partition protein [Syntrophomonadaceae bacterium]|nr:ParB/RepB/Spo0J family partition protein [Syntrophomonadaceae bacterium]
MEEIPLYQVHSRADQPRKQFSAEELEELAVSIRQYGVLQPILLNRCEDGYEIIAGERRWRAARLAGLTVVPAVTMQLDPAHMAEVALIENLQRTDLSAIEEAEAYSQLITTHGYTQDQLAENIGKSRAHITNTLRLLKLPEEIRHMLAEKVITPGHARALLALPDAARQIALARDIQKKELSVRTVENMVKMETTGKTKPPAIPSNPEWQAWEDKLQDFFGCKVSLSRRDRGKIEIHYHDADELTRILQLVGVDNN